MIGLLDANDAQHSSAHRAIADVLRDGHRLAMAASAFAECLVNPFRRGKASVLVVHNLIKRLPITVVSLDLDTASMAARLRAQHVGLHLPDALVIATAVHHAAERLITINGRWPTASTMKVKLVIEQI